MLAEVAPKPPDGAALPDEDGARRRRTARTLALVLLGGLAPIVAHNALSRSWPMVILVGAAWAGLLLPLVLVRRGRAEAAGLTLVAVLLLLLAAVVVQSSLGVFDVAMIGFPGLIVCAGLIIEDRVPFTIIVAAILATVTGLYAATLAGHLHNPLGDQLSLGAVIDVNVILLVTAVAVRFLRSQFAESLQRAQGSERQLRTLIETSPEAITRIDLRGNIRETNARAAEYLGAGHGELVGRNALELIVPADRPRALAAIERVGAGATLRDVRLDFLHADGHILPGEVSAAPLHDAAGGITGIVVQSRDITERLRTQEHLEQLQRQFLQVQKMESIGRLAGGVAHDLNNFLTAIMGFGELARFGAERGSPTADHLDNLLRAADRSRAVVAQLLTFARRQVHQPREVALNELVFGFIGLLRPLIGEHITLRTELDGDAGAVRIDPSLMEQVLINLAVNARDAMPDGGTLVIATGREQTGGNPSPAAAADWATLTVRDTGSGFTEEAKGHLFEPFFTTKPPGKGTGLGLATCYGIVQQSGGQIEVASAHGAGAGVTIRLPRLAHAAPVVAAAPAAGAARGTETLLLVEDEDLVRAVALAGLRAHGYTVRAAADAAEALRLAAADERGAIALLVTDVVLPGMNGLRLAESLRERRPGLRVLYCSGYAGEIGGVEEIARDPLTFLPKPYTTEQLAARVRALLDQPPARPA